MDSLEKDYPDFLSKDVVKDFLTKLFEGKVGAAKSEEQLGILYKEAKVRFENQIPPGFMDENKKDVKTKYSDFIIWNDLLEFANKNSKNIIFITDDRKIDWWNTYGKSRNILGPHPLLLKEFKNIASQEYYQYTPDSFLRYSKNYLEEIVSDESLSETKRISEEQINLNSAAATTRQALLSIAQQEAVNGYHTAAASRLAELARNYALSGYSPTSSEVTELVRQIESQNSYWKNLSSTSDAYFNALGLGHKRKTKNLKNDETEED